MANFYSMPLTPDGSKTLLRAVLAILPGVMKPEESALFVELRAMLWNKVERIELEQFEWSLFQHCVELWGLNAGNVDDMRESNRFCCYVDKLLSGKPSREVECAKPVEVVAVAVGKQKTLWD